MKKILLAMFLLVIMLGCASNQNKGEVKISDTKASISENSSSMDLMIKAWNYARADDLYNAGIVYLQTSFRWKYDIGCYVPTASLNGGGEMPGGLAVMFNGFQAGRQIMHKLQDDTALYLRVLEALKGWQVEPKSFDNYNIIYDYNSASDADCVIAKVKAQQEFDNWSTMQYALLSNEKYINSVSIIRAYESGNSEIEESAYLEAVNVKTELESAASLSPE